MRLQLRHADAGVCRQEAFQVTVNAPGACRRWGFCWGCSVREVLCIERAVAERSTYVARRGLHVGGRWYAAVPTVRGWAEMFVCRRES